MWGLFSKDIVESISTTYVSVSSVIKPFKNI